MYEDNRQTQKTLFGESENKNDSVQLPTRYQQYDFAKRHLGERGGGEIFPFGENEKRIDEGEQSISREIQTDRQERNKPNINSEVLETGKDRPVRRGQQIEVVGKLNSPTWQKRHESIRRVYGTEGIAPTVPTGTGGGVMPKIVASRGRYNEDGTTSQKLESRKDELTNTLTGVEKDNMVAMQWRRSEKGRKARKENMEKGKDYTPFSDGHRELVPKEGKPVGALTAQAIAKDSLLGNHSKIRRLTPTECMRLQGFPDDWCDVGADGKEISDTQKYKMAGNAVTTNVVREIIKKLLF